MFTAQDDFIGHQLPTTFDHVHNSDPAWMERLWYTGHPVSGEYAGKIIFDTGLGWHPNRNVMDVFAGVTVGQMQYNFRGSRQLRPHPLTTEVGPLKFEVLEGLRRHRLTLAPNDSAIAFDLEFTGRFNVHEEAHHFRRRKGRVTENMARGQQLGAYRGWIEVNGTRYDIEPGPWLGQRDHSWGIRGEMRTDETHPPVTYYPPFYFSWTTAQFNDRGLHVFFKERAPGDIIYLSGEEVGALGERPDPGKRMVDIQHDIAWAADPHGQRVESARYIMYLANGDKRELNIRALPARYYLKGGLYGGLNGWFQGDDRGKLYVEHDQWDLTDPEVRRIARTLNDHVIEVIVDGDIGYGIMEYGVGEGYAKYREVQRFPAI